VTSIVVVVDDAVGGAETGSVVRRAGRALSWVARGRSRQGRTSYIVVVGQRADDRVCGRAELGGSNCWDQSGEAGRPRRSCARAGLIGLRRRGSGWMHRWELHAAMAKQRQLGALRTTCVQANRKRRRQVEMAKWVVQPGPSPMKPDPFWARPARHG
jgi:hypothetical protein